MYQLLVEAELMAQTAPPGIFIMDCETFEIIGRYEMDRGAQDKHYDFWWNLPQDYMVSI